jgi:hypothetical protein
MSLDWELAKDIALQQLSNISGCELSAVDLPAFSRAEPLLTSHKVIGNQPLLV